MNRFFVIFSKNQQQVVSSSALPDFERVVHAPSDQGLPVPRQVDRRHKVIVHVNHLPVASPVAKIPHA